jgi:hypothetical protein
MFLGTFSQQVEPRHSLSSQRDRCSTQMLAFLTQVQRCLRWWLPSVCRQPDLWASSHHLQQCSRPLQPPQPATARTARCMMEPRTRFRPTDPTEHHLRPRRQSQQVRKSWRVAVQPDCASAISVKQTRQTITACSGEKLGCQGTVMTIAQPSNECLCCSLHNKHAPVLLSLTPVTVHADGCRCSK